MEKHLNILEQLCKQYLAKYNNFGYNWESDKQYIKLVFIYNHLKYGKTFRTTNPII